MATIPIYLNDTTYYGKDVDSPGDVIKRGIFNGLELADLGITVREDVVVREKMYLVSMSENITRKRIGCGEKTNSGALIAREKFLDVKNLQIWDQICAEDFGGTFWELARKKGYDVNNLEGTQIMDLLMELYTGVGKRDLLTIAQFGDETIDAGTVVVNPGPDGTPAQKAAYAAYAQKATLATRNGFWKLVFDGVAAKTADAGDPDGIVRAVTIDQVAATLPANYVRDILLPSLYDSQSELMYQVDDSEKRYVLTRQLMSNLRASFRDRATTGDAAADYFMNAAGDITYNGIKIVENRMTEQKVLTPFAANDPRTFKRRAYLIVDGGFQAGTDTYQDSQKFVGWYSRDTDLNNIQMRYKWGMQYLDGDVIVVAY
jgi:hypothetical protein